MEPRLSIPSALYIYIYIDLTTKRLQHTLHGCITNIIRNTTCNSIYMALTGTVVAGTVTGTVLAGTVVAVTGTGTKTGTVCKGANVNDNSHIKLCVFTRSV